MSLDTAVWLHVELQIGDHAGIRGVGYGAHLPNAGKLPWYGSSRALIEQVVVSNVHVVEAVHACHRESEHPNAVGESAEINAADQQVLVDHLEDVVKDVPGRLGIPQQNVLAGVEGTGWLFEIDLFQRVVHVDAPVGIARHADKARGGAREFLLETGE